MPSPSRPLLHNGFVYQPTPATIDYIKAKQSDTNLEDNATMDYNEVMPADKNTENGGTMHSRQSSVSSCTTNTTLASTATSITTNDQETSVDLRKHLDDGEMKFHETGLQCGTISGTQPPKNLQHYEDLTMAQQIETLEAIEENDEIEDGLTSNYYASAALAETYRSLVMEITALASAYRDLAAEKSAALKEMEAKVQDEKDLAAAWKRVAEAREMALDEMKSELRSFQAGVMELRSWGGGRALGYGYEE